MEFRVQPVPNAGYGCVSSPAGRRLFDLYFDGGTERKLPIKNLRKDQCRVHALWEFLIPQKTLLKNTNPAELRQLFGFQLGLDRLHRYRIGRIEVP